MLARIPIEEFNEKMESDLPDDDWDTLGGMLLDGLGHVPAIGESYRSAGYDFVIEGVEGRRITRVLVKWDGSSAVTDSSTGMMSNG